MKLQPYQLCRWCDAALQGRRRWLCLGAFLLALILSILLGLAGLVLPVLLLAGAVLGLYLLHRHHAFGTAYQRTPCSRDAQCETVLIDASLIGQGTRLRAAAQPFDAAESLSLRLGSGALLLGAAMVLTADELPRADRAALLSAVHSLNIKPGRLRSHNPVLAREQSRDVTVVTVRDGMSQRRYYVGAPDAVAGCCPTVWEGHTRPMTDADRTRIADSARYIAQGNCRVLAWATSLEEEAPVFLGMAGVGEEVHLSAVSDIASLRAMGLTVMLDAGEQPDADLDSLRALLELPEHHARADIHLAPREVGGTSALGVTRLPGDSMAEPVLTLRQRFSTIESTLRRFALMLLLPLLTGLLFACWPAALCATALLLYAAIALGVDGASPPPARQTLLVLAVSAVLARVFLLTQTPALALMGGGILTVCLAAACAVRLSGSAFHLKGPGLKASLPLPTGAGLYAAIALLCALPSGTALLLPLGFTALITAVMALLLLFEHRIFR